MSQAHVEVQQFINEHKPDVVVYDLRIPFHLMACDGCAHE